MSDLRREALKHAMPWLATAVLLIIWEIACIVFEVPEIILPRPTKIFTVFVARFDILMAFCWDTLWTTVIGVTIGIAGSFALSRTMHSLLFEVSADDPVILVGGSLLLAAVSLVACWIPARRAIRVDPMVALRYE